MDLILFLAGVFLVTFLLGRMLEKIRIPWIFSALLIGLGLAVKNPFEDVTSSPSFMLLSELGMFFLLFIIGFELEIKKVLESSKFIFRTTFVIVFAETVFGTLFVHYVFSVPWVISFLVASSFATIGEAVLLPILDEFKLTNTKLGQTMLSIGVLDDIIEVLTIIFASVILGRTLGHAHSNIWLTIVILGLLFGLAFILVKFRRHLDAFKYKKTPAFFLFVVFFIFLFIGIGKFVESAALGALLAGIALRNMIPQGILKFIDSEVRTMAYGLFAPIFFLGVGISTDMRYLLKYPLLVLAVILLVNVTKVGSSYLMGRSELGRKRAVLLGFSLCVKLSTSVVILKLLLDNGLIKLELYSVLIGTTVAFNFVVPFLMSYMITKWKINS